MCRRCTLFGKVLASYGAKQPMPCADILTVWPEAHLQAIVDQAAEEFLHDALAEVAAASGGGCLVPIQVTGDGNCLAHSVSRACHGEEAWYNLLRVKVQQELRDLLGLLIEGVGRIWSSSIGGAKRGVRHSQLGQPMKLVDIGGSRNQDLPAA